MEPFPWWTGWYESPRCGPLEKNVCPLPRSSRAELQIKEKEREMVGLQPVVPNHQVISILLSHCINRKHRTRISPLPLLCGTGWKEGGTGRHLSLCPSSRLGTTLFSSHSLVSTSTWVGRTGRSLSTPTLVDAELSSEP